MTHKEIPLSELGEIVCAWSGCDRSVPLSDIPAEWKHIVVAAGSLSEVQNLMNADVDGVLCPEHFRELLGLLKVGE